MGCRRIQGVVILGLFLMVPWVFLGRCQGATQEYAQEKAFVLGTYKALNSLLNQQQKTSQGDPFEKKKAFEVILKKHFSLPSIAQFVMARGWRLANEHQKKVFIKIFTSLLVDTYIGYFDRPLEVKIDIHGVRPSQDGGVYVQTTFINQDQSNPISVDWKVFKTKKDTFKIVDLVINNVSMGLTHRSEYASLLQQANYDIESFLKKLENNRGT